jgi:hypothetical protein
MVTPAFHGDLFCIAMQQNFKGLPVAFVNSMNPKTALLSCLLCCQAFTKYINTP